MFMSARINVSEYVCDCTYTRVYVSLCVGVHVCMCVAGRRCLASVARCQLLLLPKSIGPTVNYSGQVRTDVD